MTVEPVHVRHLAHPPLDASVRARIAPAPSGDLHVGNVRAALFNWALAHRYGGTFILRVEDTDRSRVTDEAFEAAQEILQWIGLRWDEGPGVGGPHAPYRQSERLPHYAAAVEQLLAAGAAYRAFDTPEELAAQREQRRAAKLPPRYEGSRWRDMPPEESAALAASGKPFVVRFAMPPGSTTWLDLVRGEITIEHEQIPDFTLTRSDGHPLYMLAASVDDVAMGLTHVVRGEDLTTATPRQLALYAALGHPRERWPAFGHLPLIVGPDNQPLSKRNGEVSLAWYRANGFLPEAMQNYLAQLGWSPGGDREIFGADVLTAEFSLERVSRNPARFDLKKLEAVNAAWIRGLSSEELAARLAPVLEAAGLPDRDGVVARAQAMDPEMIGTRLVRLTDAPDLLRFLLVDEEEFAVEEAAAAKALGESAEPVLLAAREAFEAAPRWSHELLEDALWAVGERLGLNRRKVSAPVRVAVTGRTHSPPLFTSMELLGRERTLRRLALPFRAGTAGGADG